MKQISEQQKTWYDGARECFVFLLDIVTLFSFVSISVLPMPALASASQLPTNLRVFVLDKDVEMSDGNVITLRSTVNPSYVVQMVIPSSMRVRSTLGPGSAVQAMATAYSSEVGQTDDNPFITASGAMVGRGVAAANFLPFGSKVKIGQKVYTIEDRMNSRYDGSYVVDIWMPSTEEAREYGVRMVTLEVVYMARD